MAKAKVKIDPKFVEAAQLPQEPPDPVDGRDVAAEQASKAITLDALSADEQRELDEQRKERERQRLTDLAQDDREREQREAQEQALANKPLTAVERERLEALEKIARGDYPPKRPHPPLGRVPPQIMRELSVLRRRAQIAPNTTR